LTAGQLCARAWAQFSILIRASAWQAVLKELDIPFQYPVAKSGVVGTIGSGKAPVRPRP
jgi:hypothetical protein